MAHHTLKSGYSRLVERLNRFPQGALPSELLFQILAMLFSEKEAELVASLPIQPFTMKQAIERGTLQHLLFDNQVLWSHRALAAVFGAILRLPPVKQALASQQVKSRYLEALVKRLYDKQRR